MLCVKKKLYRVSFTFFQPLLVKLLVGIHLSCCLCLTGMHLSETSFTKHSEIIEPVLIHRLALQPLELNVALVEQAVFEALQGLGLQVLEQQLFALLEQVPSDVLVVFFHSGDGLLFQEAAEGLGRGLVVLVDRPLGLLQPVLLLGRVVVFHVFPQLRRVLVHLLALQVLLEQPLADGLRHAHGVERRVHGGLHLLAIPDVWEVELCPHLLVAHGGG